MTMAHDEYVDNLCKEDDDLDIDDLLLAVTTRSHAERKAPKIREESIQWITSSNTAHCQNCGRVYSGETFHSSSTEPTPESIPWCPGCCTEVLFWSGDNFTPSSFVDDGGHKQELQERKMSAVRDLFKLLAQIEVDLLRYASLTGEQLHKMLAKVEEEFSPFWNVGNG